jgi:hypothetical protein
MNTFNSSRSKNNNPNQKLNQNSQEQISRANHTKCKSITYEFVKYIITLSLSLTHMMKRNINA